MHNSCVRTLSKTNILPGFHHLKILERPSGFRYFDAPMISVLLIWKPRHARNARQLGMAHGWFSWTRHSCRQRLLFRRKTEKLSEKRTKRAWSEHEKTLVKQQSKPQSKPIWQVSHPLKGACKFKRTVATLTVHLCPCIDLCYMSIFCWKLFLCCSLHVLSGFCQVPGSRPSRVPSRLLAQVDALVALRKEWMPGLLRRKSKNCSI